MSQPLTTQYAHAPPCRGGRCALRFVLTRVLGGLAATGPGEGAHLHVAGDEHEHTALARRLRIARRDVRARLEARDGRAALFNRELLRRDRARQWGGSAAAAGGRDAARSLLP